MMGKYAWQMWTVDQKYDGKDLGISKKETTPSTNEARGMSAWHSGCSDWSYVGMEADIAMGYRYGRNTRWATWASVVPRLRIVITQNPLCEAHTPIYTQPSEPCPSLCADLTPIEWGMLDFTTKDQRRLKTYKVAVDLARVTGLRRGGGESGVKVTGSSNV